MSRLMTRNPFARETLLADRVYADHDTAVVSGCDWCGSVRTLKLSGRRWLYRFRVETDAGRTFTDRNLFCSRDCRVSYGGR